LDNIPRDLEICVVNLAICGFQLSLLSSSGVASPKLKGGGIFWLILQAETDLFCKIQKQYFASR